MTTATEQTPENILAARERLKSRFGAQSVKTGGRGSVRRKKRALPKASSSEDKKLQVALKKLGTQMIPGIEEVNFFLEDGQSVVNFKNPKVSAQAAANTFVISGTHAEKKISELVPGIMSQMDAQGMMKMLQEINETRKESEVGVVNEDAEKGDEVPELGEGVQDFEEVSEKIKNEEWPMFKSEMPFGHVPVLKVGGEWLTQGSTIVKYVAKVTNLTPDDDFLTAKVDELLRVAEEHGFGIEKVMYGNTEEETKSLREGYVADSLYKMYTDIKKVFESPKADGPFMFGTKVCRNEQKGKPGDIDFQRMIGKFRDKMIKRCPPEDEYDEIERLEKLKINVVVRKRPINIKEIRRRDYDSVSCFSPNVFVHYCKYRVDGITKYLDNTRFKVDHVFGEESTNEEVYNRTVRNLVKFIIPKENSARKVSNKATCFAYGQTGSGKTFTMAGIQTLASQELFESLDELEEDYIICVSFFELYGGRCVDLLHDKKICVVREDGRGRVHIEGLKEEIVCSQDELLQVINRGNGDRTTHATEMNNVSSRSHAICQLCIRKKSKNVSYSIRDEPYGKLSLIDLAGSERGQDTKHHNKQRRAESAEINKSLLALKECIRALDDNNTTGFTRGNRHVPYRASKLTMVLKDSFSADAKSVMISCISPAASSADHTLNTLRYAKRVKASSGDPYNQSFSASMYSNHGAANKSSRRQTMAITPRRPQTTQLARRQSYMGDGAACNRKEDKSKVVENAVYSGENEKNGRFSGSTGSGSSLVLPNSPKKEVIIDIEEETDVSIQQNESASTGLMSGSKQIKFGESNCRSATPEAAQRKTEKKKSGWGVPRDYSLPSNSGRAQETSENNKMELELKSISRESSKNQKQHNGISEYSDVVKKLVDEEEQLLNLHQHSLTQDAKRWTQERLILAQVQQLAVKDSAIDEYMDSLEAITLKKLESAKRIIKKIQTFREHLALENFPLEN
eukprot:augustus_masked-scaffold_50-processed-gene-1.19-mRNA-1 protein AED:0.20 eAED:0.20 QI:0/0/0/0.66/1/1/3/0/966